MMIRGIEKQKILGASTRISRRNLLASTLFGLLGGSTPLYSIIDRPEKETDWLWYVTLLLQDTAQTRRFSRGYLQLKPKDNNKFALLSSLQRTVGFTTGTYYSWLRNVDSAIRTDFELNRNLVIEGWILSETEARLCAYRCQG